MLLNAFKLATGLAV